MRKLLPVLVFLVLITAGFWLIQPKKDQSKTKTTPPTETLNLPQQTKEEAVKTFFSLINEGKAADAINLLTPKAVADEKTKQTWIVLFNSFRKVTVKEIKPIDENVYQVVLDIELKPEIIEAENSSKFDWTNGENLRWVGVEKIDNLWRISGITQKQNGSI